MAGMLNNMANLANAKLTADLSSSATTVTLDDASPFANLGTFYATIMPAGEMSRLSNSEIVKCDYASSTTLAITRAQRGTSARAFTSGAILTNGIYIEDLKQVQYVGDGVFDTSYSAGVYTITTNNSMLPAIPSDGMKINVRINTDSSGTPGLDLQGTGAIYSIYSGALVNNEGGIHGDSSGAALLAGETYELVFDAEVGGGCWKATGLIQLADVPFYGQVGSGGGVQLKDGNGNDLYPIGGEYEAITDGGAVKYANGLMVVHRHIPFTNVNIDTALYGFYVAYLPDINFEKTFISAPTVMVTAYPTTTASCYIVGGEAGSVTTTKISARTYAVARNNQRTGVAFYLDVIAIGRWK